MKLKQRIYEDYFKKSRLSEYQAVLQSAKDAGYKMVGIYEFYNIINNPEWKKNTNKYIVNRHDIDTSPKVAELMFDIEKAVYGKQGNATYYFRNSTIDKGVIKKIETFGFETGYHYEEIATFEKKAKLKDVSKIREHFLEIEEMFIENLKNFKKKTGSSCYSIASHGDFVNVKLSMQNYELLCNQELRRRSDVYVEAYDFEIVKEITNRYADQVLLNDFSSDVIQGINRDEKVIMILTHPRNWKVDIVANTMDNIGRLMQGIMYS